jgi:hypothetical protein
MNIHGIVIQLAPCSERNPTGLCEVGNYIIEKMRSFGWIAKLASVNPNRSSYTAKTMKTLPERVCVIGSGRLMARASTGGSIIQTLAGARLCASNG